LLQSVNKIKNSIPLFLFGLLLIIFTEYKNNDNMGLTPVVIIKSLELLEFVCEHIRVDEWGQTSNNQIKMQNILI